MIKRYRSQNTMIKPIGIVQPSTAGIAAGESMRQTGMRLSQMFYKQAVEEQQRVGREYAANLVVKNEEGQTEYKPIPDAMSPIATRTAQGEIDRTYQTQLKADILSQAKALRVDANGKPLGASDYNEAMTGYLAKTAELNQRYSAYIQNISGPVVSQHLTDIKVKAYEAAMDRDFDTTFAEIENELIPDLAALSASPSGSQQIQIDPSMGLAQETGTADARDVLYLQGKKRIEKFVETHASKLETGALRQLMNKLNTAYYGGQVKGMAGRISSVISERAKRNPFMKFDEEADYLNSMISALRSEESYDAIDERTRANLAEIGFTEAFVKNPNMYFQREAIASSLATYQGTRKEQRGNLLNKYKTDITNSRLVAGIAVGKSELNDLAKQTGINDGYDVLNNFDAIFTAGGPTDTSHPIKLAMFSDSELPDAVQQVFENNDLIELAASQGKLPKLVNLYTNLTTRFDENGRPFTTTRGLSVEAIANMESLAAYGSILQTVDMNVFSEKRAELARFGDQQAKSLISAALGDKMTLPEFVRENTGITQTEELQEFQAIAPTLIHIHGKEKAAQILKKSAEKLYKQSSVLYDPQGDKMKSMWSPEARYGSDYGTFRLAADAAMAQIPGVTLWARTLRLSMTAEAVVASLFTLLLTRTLASR